MTIGTKAAIANAATTAENLISYRKVARRERPALRLSFGKLSMHHEMMNAMPPMTLDAVLDGGVAEASTTKTCQPRQEEQKLAMQKNTAIGDRKAEMRRSSIRRFGASYDGSESLVASGEVLSIGPVTGVICLVICFAISVQGQVK